MNWFLKAHDYAFTFIFIKAASSLLEEKQKDGTRSSNNGFYESRREWMGKRHYILAFEEYVLFDISIKFV